jgi:putative addiction module CopG family antidote
MFSGSMSLRSPPQCGDIDNNESSFKTQAIGTWGSQVMTTLNISLPDNMKTWISQRVTGGDYSNISDYIRSLIRRDQDQLLASREQDARKWQLIQDIARKSLQQRLAEPPPDEFADMSEAEVMQMVREEILAARQNKA